MTARSLARSSTRRGGVTCAIAAGCAVVGVVVHLASPVLPVQLAMVGLGIGLIGAAFMLAWAADAGEAVFSGGLVLAVIALLTVLPEFIIEIRFAYIQAAELVTANLTGATRLLLTGATALPLLVALLARRGGEAPAPLQLAANRRLELGILLRHVDLRHPDRRPREPDDLRRRHPHRALRPLRAARAGHAGRGARRRRRGRRPPLAPAAATDGPRSRR